MKVYNVLNRRKEEFIPLNNNDVKMYVCGMTVNGEAHLGHARQAITFDVVYKYLKFRGYNVLYASNYTDIDDKIITQAKEMGISPLELAEQRISSINKTWENLGVCEPDFRPRVTKCIPDIINFVEDLINKGFAYATPVGDVYFCVKKYPRYGTLSNRKIDELINSVRIESAESKNDALDFALWKSVQNGEFGWDSPWGKGRPGWHIECSTMIKKFLGNEIDIHGGGKDLIFPHHENEIAQSRCENDCDLAKYWLHNGLITVDGQKMSKSLGNFMLVNDLLKKYDREVIRYAILINHYTSTLDLGENAMKQAEKNLYYFYNILDNVNMALTNCQDKTKDDSILNLFTECMDDDFNSAKFIAELFNICSKLGKYKDYKLMNSLEFALEKATKILGILSYEPKEFINKVKDKYLVELNITKDQIQEKINQRTTFKQQKNYEMADKIRAELDKMGIILKDTAQGTTWDIKQLY